MAKINFFADNDKLTAQTKELAFGAKLETHLETSVKFQITSEFTTETGCNAYAVTDGEMIVVRQTIGSTIGAVNLIFRHSDRAKTILPVKYFIYRGLKYDSFFSKDENNREIVKADKNSSEYLKKICNIQKNRLSDGTINPDALLYGTDTLPEKTLLENVFNRKNANVQLCPISKGLDLGVFGEYAGFEVVLEDGEFDITLAEARLDCNDIDVSSLEYRDQKERAYHYADPAAFFAMNGIDNSKFFTKDRLYIDIRDGLGSSFNYHDPSSAKGIKLNGSETKTPYDTQGWPLHFSQAQLSNGVLSLQIEIPEYSGTSPCAFFVKYAKDVTCTDNKIIKRQDVAYIKCNKNGYTPILAIEPFSSDSIIRIDVVIPADKNSTTDFQPRQLLDYCIEPIKAKTSGAEESSTEPVTVNPDASGAATPSRAWTVTGRSKYIFDGKKALSIEMGLIEDKQGNDKFFIYYAKPSAYFENTENAIIPDRFYPNSGFYKDTNCVFNWINKRSRADIDMGSFTGVNHKVYTYTQNRKNNDYVYFIGLSADDQADIQAAVLNKKESQPSYHDITFVFEPIERQTSLPSYKLKLAGYDADGTCEEMDINITLYSADGFVYTSESFCESYCETGPRGVPYRACFGLSKDYYKEHCDFGFDWMRDNFLEGGHGYTNLTDAKNGLRDKYKRLPENNDYYVPYLTVFPCKPIFLNFFIEKEDRGVEDFDTLEFVIKEFENGYNSGNEPMPSSNPNNIDVSIEDITSIESGKLKVYANSIKKNTRVKIECEALSTDFAIDVINQTNMIVGRLIVCKNNFSYAINTQLVKLYFEGPLKVSDIEYDFSIDSNDENQIATHKGMIKKWESNMEEYINKTEQILNQSLVRNNTVRKADNSGFSYLSIKINFENDKAKYGVWYKKDDSVWTCLDSTIASQVPGAVKSRIKKIDTGSGSVPVLEIDLSIFICLTEMINDLKTQTSNIIDAKTIPIVIFPFRCEKKKENGTTDHHGGMGSTEEAALTDDKIKNDIGKWGAYLLNMPMGDYCPLNLMCHELLHALSLPHTFAEKNPKVFSENQKFIFVEQETDNIMDYHRRKYATTWRWQTELVWEHLKRDENKINPTTIE